MVRHAEKSSTFGRGGTPEEHHRILHLFVLTAFAVAQPVYDRLGERPAYLNDMGIKLPGIILFVATFSLLLPACLAVGIYGIGWIWPRSRAPLLNVAIYILLTMICAPLTYQTMFLPAWQAIVVATAAGTAATWAYFAFSRIRLAVTVAAPAIVIFPALLLLTSPVARACLSADEPRISATRWRPIPVVVFVLDDLCGRTLVNERLEIDAQRFPHFAELARGSTWYPNATSVFPYTVQAMPALLSGRYPSTAHTPTIADRPQNLFSVLGATGAFELTAFEPVSRLAPVPRRDAPTEDANVLEQFLSIMPVVGQVLLFHITPVDLRMDLPRFPQLWFGMLEQGTVDPEQRRGVFRYGTGDDRTEQFDHFLRCIDNSPQPQLYFCHAILPHFPWCYLPSGRKYIGSWDPKDWHYQDPAHDELFNVHCQQRHLLQLGWADAQLGRLLERLRETGIYDNCLLIVAADHGISFQTGEERRAASGKGRPDVMSVPLFIKAPGQRNGEVDHQNIETVDVFPTIADVLGIELQLPVDGRSVFNSAATPRLEKIWHSHETLGRSPHPVPANVLENCTVPQELRRRFGSPSDPEALYRIGPHPELVGLAVTDLPTGLDNPVEIQLCLSGTILSPEPKALVPCFIQGRVLAMDEPDEPVALAVAVNGFIRATTRTYQVDRLRDCFTAMVPEWAFHEGANEVDYFTINDSESACRLTPCLVRPSGSAVESSGPHRPRVGGTPD
jgi:hypothetical protein